LEALCDQGLDLYCRTLAQKFLVRLKVQLVQSPYGRTVLLNET